MKDQLQNQGPRDRRPSWFTALLATTWVLLAWRVHEYLVGMYFLLQVLGKGQQSIPEPPQDNFFVQFFGSHALATTIGLTVVILGKDLFLTPQRSRTWNITLTAFCLVLLFWGRLTFGIIETNWGIVR